MEKIKIQIEKLLSFEKEAKINIVYFSRKFLEIYIEKYNEKNINEQYINKKKLKKMETENELLYKICNYLKHITVILLRKEKY